jgi:hypothetical protein
VYTASQGCGAAFFIEKTGRCGIIDTTLVP